MARSGHTLRVLLGVAALTATATLTGRAAAQDPADGTPAQSGSDALTAGAEQRRPYWGGSGPDRPFAAVLFDAGAVYLRPTLQVGYGKPHFSWIGGELISGIALRSGRGYAGIRGIIPNLSVRAGVRYEYSFNDHYLPRQGIYEPEDLQTIRNSRAAYLSYEAEATTALPAPGGNILGVLTAYYIDGVPDGLRVYEQQLRVVVEPPWVWRARIGYLLHFGWLGSLRLGPAAEVIHVPNRETGVTVRAGPLVSVALTHHLEAAAAVMIVAATQDELGLAGADLGQLGLRYRWATGDRWAEFP